MSNVISTVVQVNSSCIGSVSYNAENLQLTIRFQNGRFYRYRGVSEELYNAFLEAPSQGRFFNRNIRGHFTTEEVNGYF